ncbi:MAG: hypothetical protein B7Z14_17190 [Bosea sp. 32-68-6]|nr:MAG: hypothetical protein B7Z14_17190 [Bosea sp. 32-68-6]
MAAVSDVQKKLGDVFAHAVTVKDGVLKRGAPVELTVDHARRTAIRANHSATHLLHEALRLVLGDHVAQKGSLVSPDRLRFDFSHPKPISDEELREVEEIANAIVLKNEPVSTRLMSVDEAIASGARALFGEKYGDEVRVVAMGTNATGRAYSVELCGGTHASRTGDIGLVSIVGESAVAAGVRRLEAMTGNGARLRLNTESRLLDGLASLLKVPAHEAGNRLTALIEERRKLDRELSDARKKLAMGGGGEAQGTPDLTERFDGVALVRAAAEALGGKGGGGRRDMAQAGGPDGDKAQAALDAVAAAMG